MPRADEQIPPGMEILHLKAAELRMVADLFERQGRVEEAADIRAHALEIDPPLGRC